MTDCVNCATGWGDGPLCREHANDKIERLQAALWIVGDHCDAPGDPWVQMVVGAVLGDGWWHRRNLPVEQAIVAEAEALR